MKNNDSCMGSHFHLMGLVSKVVFHSVDGDVSSFSFGLFLHNTHII